MPSLFELMQQQKLGANGALPPPVPQEPVAPPAPPRSLFELMQEQKGNTGAAPSGGVVGEGAERGWGETLTSAAVNLPGSIISDVVVPTAKGIKELVTNPVGVGKSLGEMGVSGMAEGISNYISENYGSVEKFKAALAEHPGKILSDISMAAFPMSAVKNVPGVVGKIGKGAAAVSNATDPLVLGAKGAQKILGNTQKLGTAIVGTTSATGRGPKVAIEAGKKGAYEGAKRFANDRLGTTFDVPAKGESVDDILKGQMRGKRNPDEHVQMLEDGIKAIKQKGQAEIDAAHKDMFKDRKRFKLDDVDKVLDDLDKKVHKGGTVASPAAAEVLSSIRKVVDNWRRPKGHQPIVVDSVRNPRGRVIDVLGPDGRPVVDPTDLQRLNLNPATATSREYLEGWLAANRSGEGMDRLKQALQKVYPEYEAKFGAADATAKEVAGKASSAVIAQLDNYFNGRYSQSMKAYGDKMSLIRETLETFGYKRDTQSRRLTAMNRDNVVADYGARVKLAQKFEAESGIVGLGEATSGRSMASLNPRNLTSGVGSGAALLYTGNPVAAILSFAVHMPRVVGESARALGKVQGWVIKPTKAVFDALKKIGVSPHGASVGAQATARTVNAAESRKKLRDALAEQAEKLGYTLHGRVLDQLASQLTSEEVDTFLKGINHMNKNKKLMTLIEAMGTKGKR